MTVFTQRISNFTHTYANSSHNFHNYNFYCHSNVVICKRNIMYAVQPALNTKEVVHNERVTMNKFNTQNSRILVYS